MKKLLGIVVLGSLILDAGQKLKFIFEKIGDQKTSRDEMKKNLIKVLEKNVWNIKK